jgi:hypothetical protein
VIEGAYSDLLDDIEAHLRASRFGAVDGILRGLVVEQLPENTILGVLTLTSFVSEYLLDRPAFLQWAEISLQDRLGAQRAAKLLRFRR